MTRSDEMIDRGAHFHRTDFQVHTPRDNQWTGKDCVSDAERTSYAEEFVRECRSRGLHAVAITDHHDFCLFPYIRRAAAAERDGSGPVSSSERLTVFPGLELTLSVPCQAILILDADFGEDRLNDVLTCLGISPTDPAESRLPSVTPLHFTELRALHDAMDKQAWLKGKYIVLPNVTDSGHQTLMRSGFHAKYRDMPCVGGYLDGTVDKVGLGNQRIFAGENLEYGNKKIALFQTSDSRHESFKDLGKNSTWVKWATPTAEALRQACLASESRISQEAPAIPNTWISRVSVSNSKFLGPVELALNPQYSAVIGGRGTGKSTLLDYMRWTLCDQPPVIEQDDDLGDTGARRRRLVQATLAPYDAHVDIHFTINSIHHVVRRSAASGTVEIQVGDRAFEAASEEDVRALLPIQAYSQKQLSGVSVRLDELTRFVTAPIRRRLDEIDRTIADLDARIRENYATLQRSRGLQTARDRERLNERSLNEQAANLRTSLETVSPEDRATLDAKPTVDSARGIVSGWERALGDARGSASAFVGAVQRLIDELTPVPESTQGPIPDLHSLGDESREVLSALLLAVENGLTAFDQAQSSGSAIDTHRRQVRSALESFDLEYTAVRDRSTSHATKLAELAEVERRLQSSREVIAAQTTELQSFGEPQVAHDALMAEFTELARERSATLETQCGKVSELSDRLIRARLQVGQGFAEVADKFRGLVSGSGIRGAKFEEVFSGLRAETDPLATWSVVLGEVEVLAAMESADGLTTEAAPTLGRLGFAAADITRVANKATSASWLTLALTPVRDEPVFEYQTKDGAFIDFAVASAGQQATALLCVLLAQSGSPLMIDQPEDDLDSQVVQDIVQRTWQAKSNRQLIFSSHNANLVVNGDAELVVCCDYRKEGDQSGGVLKLTGAIDVTDVREEIARIMEGGEKAFRLRKEKYGF